MMKHNPPPPPGGDPLKITTGILKDKSSSSVFPFFCTSFFAGGPVACAGCGFFVLHEGGLGGRKIGRLSCVEAAEWQLFLWYLVLKPPFSNNPELIPTTIVAPRRLIRQLFLLRAAIHVDAMSPGPSTRTASTVLPPRASKDRPPRAISLHDAYQRENHCTQVQA
jgi:hypothetical protein